MAKINHAQLGATIWQLLPSQQLQNQRTKDTSQDTDKQREQKIENSHIETSLPCRISLMRAVAFSDNIFTLDKERGF